MSDPLAIAPNDNRGDERLMLDGARHAASHRGASHGLGHRHRT
jgi:hypothetical protein